MENRVFDAFRDDSGAEEKSKFRQKEIRDIVADSLRLAKKSSLVAKSKSVDKYADMVDEAIEA